MTDNMKSGDNCGCGTSPNKSQSPKATKDNPVKDNPKMSKDIPSSDLNKVSNR